MTRGSTQLRRNAMARSRRLLWPPPKKSARWLRSPILILGGAAPTERLLVDRHHPTCHGGRPKMGFDPQASRLAQPPATIGPAENAADCRGQGYRIAWGDR